MDRSSPRSGAPVPSVYAPIKRAQLALLRAPAGPPDAPAGSHASVEVFRASPRYLTYRVAVLALSGAVGAFALCASLAATIADGEGVAIAVVVLAIVASAVAWLVALFLLRIDFDLRYYVVTDRSLRVREGAWTVAEKTLTYANVQNLRIVQGPIQRLFGISDLRVDTAGGGGSRKGEKHGEAGHTATLAGIENARLVRDRVLAHVRALQPNAGLGDLEEARRVGPRAAAGDRAALVLELARLRDAAAGLRRAASRSRLGPG